VGAAALHLAGARAGRVLGESARRHPELADDPEGGTRAELFLPVGARGSTEEGPGEEPATTILVVDDQSEERKTAGRYLEEAGFRVLAADDEAAALALWERSGARVEAVILNADAGREGERSGGPRLLERIREVRPELPIIYSSRALGMERALRSLSAGHTHFIGKPFSRSRLLEKLQEALGRREVGWGGGG